MCCCHFIHIVGFAVGSFAAMEGIAVPRSGPLLFETFAVSQGLVAFTENGIAVAFATTAFGNDIAFGVVIYEVAQVWAGKVNIAQGFSVFTGKKRGFFAVG